MTLSFRPAHLRDKNTLFSWLQEPHVTEFWDSSQAHKDDILNFMRGRITPSDYCDGNFVYYIAEDKGVPYALMMIIPTTHDDPIDAIKKEYLSNTGATYGIDYMIGNSDFIGKGYGANTLMHFIDFYRANIDQTADTFLIDPAANNPRAKHVYEKAGFTHVADFVMEEPGASGAGEAHHLLVKRF